MLLPHPPLGAAAPRPRSPTPLPPEEHGGGGRRGRRLLPLPNQRHHLPNRHRARERLTGMGAERRSQNTNSSPGENKEKGKRGAVTIRRRRKMGRGGEGWEIGDFPWPRGEEGGGGGRDDGGNAPALPHRGFGTTAPPVRCDIYSPPSPSTGD